MPRTLLALLAVVLFAGSVTPAEPPRLDALGDPLPEGAIFRIGTERFRAGDGVIGRDICAVLPGARQLLALTPGRVVLYDADSGQVSQSFEAPHQSDYALSADGKLLALAAPRWSGLDLYDLAEGKRLARFAKKKGSP